MYFIFLNIIWTGTEQIEGWHMCRKTHESNRLKKVSLYKRIVFAIHGHNQTLGFFPGSRETDKPNLKRTFLETKQNATEHRGIQVKTILGVGPLEKA